MALDSTFASPPVIGLTGSIGAGKSVVASMLQQAGCVVADADAAVRDLLNQPGIIDTLVRWWGGIILGENGSLDRSVVARIVFADPKERIRLEQLLHPLVSQRREAVFSHVPPETPALVIDAPLLMEVGLDEECDVVLYVDSAPAHCRQRIAVTRGWSEEEFDKRSKAQIPVDQKRARADIVISNNSDLAALEVEIKRFLEKLTGGFESNEASH